MYIAAYPILVFAVYFISRQAINRVFTVLHRTVRSRGAAYILLSFILLPGTVFHELAHYFMAVITGLEVREVRLFPRWEKNSLLLGSVHYVKKDVVRSIMVGVAPFIAGMGLLWGIAAWGIFPAAGFWLNLLLGYAIFSASSAMFSSAQDLQDALYIIPLGILAGGAVYVLTGWTPDMLLTDPAVNGAARSIDYYLVISAIINGGVWLLFTILHRFFRK